MFVRLCLLGGLMAPAQLGSPAPADRAQPPPRVERRIPPAPQSLPGEWLLTPQVVAGQELVYRGTFTEQAIGRHVQLNRTYRFENRLMVLEVALRGIEIGVLTLINDETVANKRPGE